MIRYDLQFFAKDGPGGEKTEPATAKKLQDARREGQVAKSKEIVNGFSLLGLFLILKFYVGYMGTSMLALFPSFYDNIPEVTTFYHGFSPQADVRRVFRMMLLRVLIIVAPILLLGVVIAFVCDLYQVKWRPTTAPLKPKLRNLNPINGVKKIISVNSLVELIKSILKIGLIAYVCYNFLKDKWIYLMNIYDISLMQGLQILAETVTDLGIRIAAVYMLIALADYIYQKTKFSRDMKMTKQEVKDEYKNTEGDPQIKGQIKARMREASRRRMMSALPQADVVITNPTHYAVAIKYDPEVADAPLVIAKGEDYLAQRIKEVARENQIEIVENKPLARMLYANVDVGQAVPPELYQAVAEVLAFVYHLQGKV